MKLVCGLVGLLVAGTIFASDSSEKSPVHKAAIPGIAVVKELKGNAQYAYDSSGWQQLKVGKHLRPGASIRTAANGKAILKIAGSSNYISVSPSSQLTLVPEAPIEEVASATTKIASTN